MKIPEIGRLQPDPQHLEITFILILTCSGLRDISPYSRCCRAWRSSTG